MITIVSGFQRCGSSLMCQMLSAGGMTVFHDPEMGYPAFETQLQVRRADDPAWLTAIDGQAVKWLEPQRGMPSRAVPELRILWMTRDHREQAKSAVKFLRDVGGIFVPSGAARGMAASYRRDEPKVVRSWQERGRVRVMRFERLLSDSLSAAAEVAAFLGQPLNVDRMAAQVMPRDSACLDGFLELALMERRS